MTKLPEIKKPVYWCLFSLGSLILAFVMPYCEGRLNTVWVMPPLLPADLLPLIFLFVSGVILFLCWVQSWKARQKVFATGLMFLAGLLFFFLWFACDRAAEYQDGFRDYAASVLTLDEWRGIARYAQEHLKPDEFFRGPRRSLWDEKERALWSGFTATTQIQKLDPSLVIIARTGYTEIAWGGGLVGHRCVDIAASENGLPQYGRQLEVKFIVTDIATFVGD